MSYRRSMLHSTSGARELLSGAFDSSIRDLRSAAFSTRPAATLGSVTVLANLRSVVACCVRYCLPTTFLVSGLSAPRTLRCSAGFVPTPRYKVNIEFCSRGFKTKARRSRGTVSCVSGFLGMRIHEEDCNMVLLAGVSLLSVAVAGAAALLEPASATDKSRPAFASSAAAPTSADRQPLRLVDQVPVRVVGAPFVPNTN